MKRRTRQTQTLGGKIKSGLGFGALAGIGAKAVGVVGGSLKSLVSELDNTNSAWTSFASNMAMSGMGARKSPNKKGPARLRWVDRVHIKRHGGNICAVIRS